MARVSRRRNLRHILVINMSVRSRYSQHVITTYGARLGSLRGVGRGLLQAGKKRRPSGEARLPAADRQDFGKKTPAARSTEPPWSPPNASGAACGYATRRRDDGGLVRTLDAGCFPNPLLDVHVYDTGWSSTY